ncbi:hypothetical protein [Microbacterium stercoris]|uniref:Peptide zinc metalloprotease protein n=1 Tax=Microbacterium stercoris TaxID=2820289 RepID=A0A939QL23_9MICO|nr:hypothetical protein [Microbacterium stercoris]MBO3663642.1 hypothetical protein [Microbacterium stercoris]
MITDAQARGAASREWLDRIRLSRPDSEGRVLISTAAGPVARVPGLIGGILHAVKRDPVAESRLIGARCGVTAEQVEAALGAVAAMPAVADAPARLRWVQFRAPFTVQFTFFDPSRVIRPDGLLCRLVRVRGFWPVVIVLDLVGAAVVAMHWALSTSPLHSGISIAGYGWLMVGMLASMFAHEFGHAVVLTAYGGRSPRMGFMLFYLAPAFFCDVRDNWSIAREKRVRVALAGVAAQGVIAAVTGAVAFLVPREAGVALATVAFFNVAYWAINLIPFVKLDGYVALAGYLDRPNLRDSSIAAFRARASRMLLGGPRVDDGITRRWVAFGAVCFLFPSVLVIGVLLALSMNLSALGTAGDGVILLAIGILVVWTATRGWSGLKSSWSAGLSRWRAVASWSAIGAAVAAIALLLPLPVNAIAGVYVRDGQAQLATLSVTHVGELAGTEVTVHEPGMVLGRRIGVATVTGGFAPCEIPLSAAFPVSGSPYRLDGWCAPLDAAVVRAVSETRDDAGAVVLRLGTRAPVQWVAEIWGAAFTS